MPSTGTSVLAKNVNKSAFSKDTRVEAGLRETRGNLVDHLYSVSFRADSLRKQLKAHYDSTL